jgi:hypothetical protein
VGIVEIAVLSLLVPHKTGSEFMCSGKIAVLSLLIPHKTGGEFMCSGERISRERTAIFPEHMNSLPVLCGTSRERTAIFPEHLNSPSDVVWKDSSYFSTSPTQNRG